MSAIRAATVLALWGGAFGEQRASADELLQQLAETGFNAGVRADDAVTAERTGLPGPGSAGAGTIDLLALLRESGTPELLLPVPGDLRGLPPKSTSVIAALDAGAAVLLPAAALLVIPTNGFWRVHDATGPEDGRGNSSAAGSVLEAELALDGAIRTATRRLMVLDIARDSASVREQIAAKMRDAAVPLPPGVRRSCSALLAKAISLQALLEVAQQHQTGAVSRHELGAVDDALRPLAAAVRFGRLAAVAHALVSRSHQEASPHHPAVHKNLNAYE
ncbi:hypothetical protein EH165_07670 [Nakamurella antarctica]|uniref:Uncharacterized protein n=1 Tax=Nakamurella antarctica TaxID=1902245 RepID=A0A3G8ZLK7_9ACTN|nr:hypothetical protein [Nakamurella antarctica]AZI58038.1 hypothetical protein EH165_07670 [Nakamurella antarctica]